VDVLSELKLWNKIAPREIRIFDNKIGAAWNHLQELRKSSFQTATSRCSTDLICFLLLTGTRWSEAANLRWDHVNLEEGWFFLENTKNSDSVTLPLSDTLRDILESRPRDSEYVFPARSGKGPIKDIRGAFSKLANAIEMDKLSAHDLRRTYTNIAWKKCRIPLDVVKLLTNHRLTTDVTIEHYSDKGDMRFLADEANQVAGWIEEQATEPE
jgi:integrase